MLILIYYFKNVISFRDIEQLFLAHQRAPLFPWFQPELEELLQRNLFAGKRAAQALAGRRHGKILTPPADIQGTMTVEDREYLQLFAFISELAF